MRDPPFDPDAPPGRGLLLGSPAMPTAPRLLALAGPAAESLTPKPRNYTDPEWQASVTDEQINAAIDDLREEWRGLRFDDAVGRMTNTSRIGQIKRDIARLKTVAVLNADSLGVFGPARNYGIARADFMVDGAAWCGSKWCGWSESNRHSVTRTGF